jgi:nucleoside-diphosphate-sugar epimerase
MQVLVTGATGFIGAHFAACLAQRGHAVQRVTRRPSRPGDVAWEPARGAIDAATLRPPDAVVHLAGENLADGRWTEAKKQRIRDSRVQGTHLLSATVASLPHPPRVLVSASAVGYYGHRGTEVLTEESGAGKGFLAAVCRQWEAATQPAVHAGIRTVCLRMGLVLGADGGVLHTSNSRSGGQRLRESGEEPATRSRSKRSGVLSSRRSGMGRGSEANGRLEPRNRQTSAWAVPLKRQRTRKDRQERLRTARDYGLASASSRYSSNK